MDLLTVVAAWRTVMVTAMRGAVMVAAPVETAIMVWVVADAPVVRLGASVVELMIPTFIVTNAPVVRPGALVVAKPVIPLTMIPPFHVVLARAMAPLGSLTMINVVAMTIVLVGIGYGWSRDDQYHQSY
jgi:hypothetical protein